MIHQVFSTLATFKGLDGLNPGLNVLLSQKTEGASRKQTRNRAGKTSFVELVHFLLGADAGKDSIFRAPALAQESFGMRFDLGSQLACIERSGGNKTKNLVTLAHSEPVTYSTSDWCSLLGEQIFGLDSSNSLGRKPPSFRALFGYFARRQASGAFTTPEKQAVMQSTGEMQVALMFLLGLDWEIARDWQVVRENEKTLEELKKAAGRGAFGAIIGKSADLRTELTIRETRLRKLQAHIEGFQVLPEYRELELESDKLTQELNELVNANTLDLSLMRDLQEALASEVPPDHRHLQAVYEEAGIALPGLVKRRYEDVQTFHDSVIRNRKDYLSGEYDAAKQRIQMRDRKKAQLDQRRAEILGILKSHGALEHFIKLQGELGAMKSEVESLRQRFEAAEKLEGTKNELEIERNRLTIRLRRNFAEQRDRLAQAIMAFEETSERLYESAGSMTIDETSNGPVFRFPMQGQRSKGIKNMQIFCFDMMLMRLCAGRQIGPGFLIHDSHLFDGVDGRQVISALRLGSEIARELDFQYIVTMNEDDAFKETIDGFDLNDYVLPVRLTDATQDGGLFGSRFG